MKIEKVLDEYLMLGIRALSVKMEMKIRGFMSKQFVGYWAHPCIVQTALYYYDYELNGVLKQINEAKKSFEAVSITERKNGDECLVLGKETNVISGVPYNAQCMFVWRKENNEWKLLREYIELER